MNPLRTEFFRAEIFFSYFQEEVISDKHENDDDSDTNENFEIVEIIESSDTEGENNDSDCKIVKIPKVVLEIRSNTASPMETGEIDSNTKSSDVNEGMMVDQEDDEIEEGEIREKKNKKRKKEKKRKEKKKLSKKIEKNDIKIEGSATITTITSNLRLTFNIHF